MMTEEAKCHL